MEFRRRFTAAKIQDAIEAETPSKRTIRNTLDAMETMGFLTSEGGAGRAPRQFSPAKPDSKVEPEGYSPRQISHTSTVPYPGGKSGLAEWIIDTMPVHDTYVEVFGGGAGVLFNKPRSKYEIYNDLNDDLTQFFRVVRDFPDELATWLQSVPYSRSQYEEWVADFYDGFRPNDPIERAGRFFALRYMQYAGVSSTANGFKTRARRSPARTFDNARNRIHSLAQRFDQVTIEKQDYREAFQTYDDSAVDVLFYVDPPYVGTENHYSGEFDHETLVDCLQEVENDWMVSCKEVPEGLAEYTVRECEGRHRMKRASGSVTESLVCNFDPSERPDFG
jgi:DNA adenine methylase